MGAGPHDPYAIIDVHVTGWNRDPWTGGVYSTLAVGGVPEHRSVLGGLIRGRLVLAGEHVSVAHPATMHGAYNSGLQAAQTLLAAQPNARSAIVVGAGLSGLAAARRMQDGGLRVTVLEATAYVGGRARTETTAGGVSINPGAAWIHGTDGNPLVAMAERNNVAFRPWPAQVRHARIGEGLLAPDAVVAVESALDDVHRALGVMSDAAIDDGSPDVAMRGPLMATLAGIADAHLRAAVATRMSLHFESLVAGVVDDLSFHWGDEPFSYPGGDAYLLAPTRPIVADLAEGIAIRHGAAVNIVQCDDESIRVHTMSGDAVSGDVAVVTVPAGPLQAGHVRFEPPLPDVHREALAHLRMGQKAKVFVHFASRWWGEAEELWAYPPEADGSESAEWALWVDASEPTGVPMLCGFLGGVPALRAQELGETADGRAVLAAEIADQLRWLR